MTRVFLYAAFAVFAIVGCSKNPPDDTGGEAPPPDYVDQKIYVGSVEELNARSGTLSAGDTVVLRNGTYLSKKISVVATGSAQNPVVLTGETPGKTILVGESNLSISGRHIVVRDLWFKDPVSTAGGAAIINFRTRSSELAYDCRVTNCAITGSGLSPKPDVDYKWVSLYGTGNQVDGCTFSNKMNMGTLMVVWFPADAGAVPAHKILNNHFSRPFSHMDGSSQINGQETIRIGDSSSSMRRGNCLVEGNVFYRCDGETEAISNKSCFNVYRGNLMESTSATLTLRHGNDCTVENNYFMGGGKENTGGVRIIGERHTVRGNWFEDLRGTNYRAAICIIRGVPDSELHEYFQVKNALVENNTIVNCTSGIHANYGSSTMTDPVISTTVRSNTIVNDQASNIAVRVDTTPSAPEITWNANRIFGGRFVGISTLTKVDTRPSTPSQNPTIQTIKTGSGVNWTLN